MLKRHPILSASAGLLSLVLLLVPVWFCGCCPQSGSLAEWKYRYRIKPGMTLEDVERILGPGTIRSAPPGTPDYKGGSIPVVEGDEFYVWEQGGLEIWLGFKDGRVHDKYFDAPSL